MLSPSHSTRFYHPKILSEQYRSLSSSLCSFPHSPVTSSHLGPYTFLNTPAYVPPSMWATKCPIHTKQPTPVISRLKQHWLVTSQKLKSRFLIISRSQLHIIFFI
jgi:hypothetical protein